MTKKSIKMNIMPEFVNLVRYSSFISNKIVLFIKNSKFREVLSSGKIISRYKKAEGAIWKHKKRSWAGEDG